MRAEVGDQLVIQGHRVGEPRRVGQVVEVRGEDGGPPYRVRWDETGTTTLLFPGSDCRVQSLHHDEHGKRDEHGAHDEQGSETEQERKEEIDAST